MASRVSEQWVAGADGCRSGWVVVLLELHSGERQARIASDFASILSIPEAPVAVAVDVPIGLLDGAVPGGRECERLARKLLRARCSSVFSAPTRGALEAFRVGVGYRDVSAANRGRDPNAPGISQQTFGILPKIDEVDRAMTPALQGRVMEVHPELCFAEANAGAPMTHSKKRSAGRKERAHVLQQLGFPSPLELLGPRRPRGVLADDLLDACIACWTAGRVVTRSGIVLPATPPVDAKGLRMELWR